MTDTPLNYEVLDAIVGRVMAVDDVTIGAPKQGFLVRYRGRLRLPDSEQAYDSLSSQLKSQNITPLFRWDGSNQAILLVPGMPQVRASNPMVNLVLFILTLLSVLYIGGMYGLVEALPANPLQAILVLIQRGWPYAVSLLAILGAHEFGHYLMGRYHGVHVTLPYFIPMPFGLSPFGTLGAFINMKEMPRNRKILFDIGIAGPLAGMAVAIPVLFLGLALSNLNQVVLQPGFEVTIEGNNLLYLFAKFVRFGQLLPVPVSYGGVSPLLYWIRYFFTSMPLPINAMDVNLHPVAWAGWAGLLVTSLNLIPVGQLDGGHVLYVLFGRKNAQRITPFILGALVLLGLAWPGWWLWAALVFMLGSSYAEPLDQITPIDPVRKWIGVLGLVIFILTFTPVPLSLLSGG